MRGARTTVALVLAGQLAAPARTWADPPPDFARAKQLYDAASSELAAQQWAAAVRDFTGAFQITHDPVLFFKIGDAHAGDGDCDGARAAYQRYLHDATPAPSYVKLTQDRIANCIERAGATTKGMSLPGEAGAQVTPTPTPTPQPQPQAQPQPGPGPQPAPGPGPGAPAVTKTTVHGHGSNGAWIAVGGAVALATVGGVLAFSATSSEQDIKDLYVSANGKAPVFQGATKQRYDDLVAEGQRYQYLSWAAFGAAAVGAGIAALLFTRGHSDHEHVAVAPVVTPQLVGLDAAGSF